MAADSTIVIVPRERFTYTRESLENILRRTARLPRLIYVDGGSPPPIRDYLQQQADRHGFTLLRSEHYLSPNEARNLALPHVRTRYVVVADNDTLVSPNWIERLQACADETGAWVVGPLYCERLPEQTLIHMAGGEVDIREVQGRRTLHELHYWQHQPVAAAKGKLVRCQTGLVEFHTMLIRMDTFDQIGLLDERLLSTAEHVDLCLLVRQAGGQVFLEPNTAVTYVPPSWMNPLDYDYFHLRWSHAWNEASLRRLADKWGLALDGPAMLNQRRWLQNHRQLGIAWLQKTRNILGRRIHKRFVRYGVGPLEAWFSSRRHPPQLAVERRRPEAYLASPGGLWRQEAA